MSLKLDRAIAEMERALRPSQGAAAYIVLEAAKAYAQAEEFELASSLDNLYGVDILYESIVKDEMARQLANQLLKKQSLVFTRKLGHEFGRDGIILKARVKLCR